MVRPGHITTDFVIYGTPHVAGRTLVSGCLCVCVFFSKNEKTIGNSPRLLEQKSNDFFFFVPRLSRSIGSMQKKKENIVRFFLGRAFPEITLDT